MFRRDELVNGGSRWNFSITESFFSISDSDLVASKFETSLTDSTLNDKKLLELKIEI